MRVKSVHDESIGKLGSQFLVRDHDVFLERRPANQALVIGAQIGQRLAIHRDIKVSVQNMPQLNISQL